jgi:predicted RNA polymerase sigma factor
MFAKRAVVVCVAAWMLGGCGGGEELAVEEAPADAPNVTAQKWPPICSPDMPDSWIIRFVNVNGVELGRHECTCGDLVRYGSETPYTRFTRLGACLR